MSTELQTKVTIERVSIHFVRSVVLEKLYIEDQHGDTLIYTDRFEVNISNLSTKNRMLNIDKVVLKNGDFNLNRYSKEEHDNLHFLTEYFSSEDTTTTSNAPWKINLKSLELVNMHFSRRIEDDTALVYGVDFSNLNIRNINGSFSNYTMINDSIFIGIDHLSFSDQSGFKVFEIASQAKISNDEIRLKNLVIRTDHTNLNGDLTFTYDSLADFDEFTHNIHWAVSFRRSNLSFTDVAFFAPELKGMDKTVQVDGSFKGTVNRFKGKNVTLSWGEHSFFRGNVSMFGLPSWDDTYMDILADEVRTDKKDIEWIPLPPFDTNTHVEVPDNLTNLGTVKFSGKFTGFASDFVAYGNFKTDIGSISSDLNLKNTAKYSAYKGHISANAFNVGMITDVKDLGRVTFSADVKGTGLKLKDINAELKGKVEILEFRNYAYKNITLDGQFAKRLFNGSFVVDDENAMLDFRGTIDYRNELPEFNFIADIKKAHLGTLNLFKLNEEISLQTTISTHFIGNKPDNMVGNIQVENTNFLSGKKLYHLNSIEIQSAKGGSNRSINVQSDILDADFEGDFEFATLPDAFKEILPRYLPSVILPKKEFIGRQNFTFDVRIKNMDLVSELFLPSWKFSAQSRLNGRFNKRENNLSLNLNSPYISYKTFTLNDINVTVKAGENVLQLDLLTSRLMNDETILIEQPQVHAKAKADIVDFVIRLADEDTFPNRAHLAGKANFLSATNYSFSIDSSFIVINNEQWKLRSQNQLAFDSTGIAFNNLVFEKTGQQLSLDGKISNSSTELMKLHFDNFELNNLNPAIKGSGSKVGGRISGDVALKDVYKKFEIESDLGIRDFTFNDDTLGNAKILSKYDSEGEVIGTNLSIIKGTAKILEVNGNYYLTRKENNLDMRVRLNNFYLHTLERYIDDIVSDIHGKVSSDLQLTGTANKPVFNGTVDLAKTSLIINYLNTRYSFTTQVRVKENELEVKNLTLTDVNNNEAIANGKVYHNYFRNFNFDVNLNADHFQVLNTTLKDNNLYYGLANATGNAHFYGPLESMNMDITLSPEKNTVLNIPLNTASEISQSDFVTFIDRRKDTSSVIKRNTVNLSGIKLNMNLYMNTNALINIIFDEKIGDVISGRGNGSLRLDINTAGAFNMYGNYSIDRGDYLFTLQNLINKKFTIEPGGKITWAGDPYEATVDISAVYVVYTSSLYNVLPDSSYKRRLPVECRLFLSNKLMNPTITYEINVRGLDPTAQGVVKTLLNNEQEIDKQMFGLLVLNQFVPPNAAGQVGRLDAGAGAGASASELLSNQVSNWLGQLSKDVNIGFNYRARDTYSNEEIQLMFSKSLFKDRLTVEGNVGYLNSLTAANSNVVGDFYAEWKLNEEGRFRLKGFNRSNADNIINYSQSPYTQGLGLFYRQEFNTFKDLLIKWRLMHKPEETSVNQ